MGKKSSINFDEFFVKPNNMPAMGIYKALCKKCGKTISACVEANSNLIRHLQRRHPEDYARVAPNPTDSEADTSVFDISALSAPAGGIDQRVGKESSEASAQNPTLVIASNGQPVWPDTDEGPPFESFFDSDSNNPSVDSPDEATAVAGSFVVKLESSPSDAATTSSSQPARVSLPGVWRDYFAVVDPETPSGIQGNMVAICRVCEKQVRFCQGVSSNLLSHLKLRHPQAYMEYLSRKTKRRHPDFMRAPQLPTSSYSPMAATTSSTFVEPSFLNQSRSATMGDSEPPSDLEHGAEKYPLNHPKQREITGLLIEFLLGDDLPLSLITQPGFIRFMETVHPLYQIPSTRDINQILLDATRAKFRRV